MRLTRTGLTFYFFLITHQLNYNKCQSETTIEAERTSFVRYMEVENMPLDDAEYFKQLYGPASRFHFFV